MNSFIRYPSYEEHTVFMLRWILEWFHAFIISMHDWAAAPCGLVVRLWLSPVIELCADSKYAVTGFKNLKRPLRCSDTVLIKQGTAAFRHGTKCRTVEEVSAEVVEQRWEVQGGRCGEKLTLCLLCQSFSLFQVLTQHLVNTAASLGCHGRLPGWFITPDPPKASSD